MCVRVEENCTFALFHHGFRLSKCETLHGLITWPSCSITGSGAPMSKLHQHPTVKSVAFLTRGISSPRNTIHAYKHTQQTLEMEMLKVYRKANGKVRTTGFGQVFLQLLTVLLMQDVIDTGVDQLLLLVLQILSHIVRHKHNVSLSVHHKQEAIQRLKVKERKKGVETKRTHKMDQT